MASISSGGMHALLTSLLLRSSSNDDLTRGQKDVIDMMINLIQNTLEKIDRVMIDGKVEEHEAGPLKKNLRKLNKQVSLLSGSKGVGDATRNRLEAVNATAKKMIYKIEEAEKAGAFEQDDGANDSASAIAGAMGAGGIGGIDSAIPDAVQAAGSVDMDASSGNGLGGALSGLSALRGSLSSGSDELSSISGTLKGLSKLTGGEEGHKLAKAAQEMDKMASKMDEASSGLSTADAGLNVTESPKSDSDLANSQKDLRPNERIEEVQKEVQDFSHDLEGIVNTLNGVEKLSGQNEKVQLQQMVQRIQKTQSVVLEAVNRFKIVDPRQAAGKTGITEGATALQRMRPLDMVHQVEKLGSIESDAAGTLDLTHADNDSGFVATEMLDAADTFESIASTLDGMAGLLGNDGGEALGELSAQIRGFIETLEAVSGSETPIDEGYEDGGLDSIRSGDKPGEILGGEVADFVDDIGYVSSTLAEFGEFAGGEIGLQMGRMAQELERSAGQIKNGVESSGISAEIGSGS